MPATAARFAGGDDDEAEGFSELARFIALFDGAQPRVGVEGNQLQVSLDTERYSISWNER